MRNEGGFTLIELIMVIVIIGILAVVAIQKYPTTEISLETAADMIKSDIRSVQALSMAKHTIQTLTFNSSTEYVFPALGEGNKTRNFADIFEGGISLSPVPANITFNSLGEPTAGYGNPITITTGSTTKTLMVLQYTGRVE